MQYGIITYDTMYTWRDVFFSYELLQLAKNKSIVGPSKDGFILEESPVEHVNCEGARGRLCLESRSPEYCWSKTGVRHGEGQSIVGAS
jgi:hypothetical protein